MVVVGYEASGRNQGARADTQAGADIERGISADKNPFAENNLPHSSDYLDRHVLLDVRSGTSCQARGILNVKEAINPRPGCNRSSAQTQHERAQVTAIDLEF